LRIVVGSSGIVEHDWIETDIEYLNLLHATDWQRYFQPDSITAILAEHVWEHLTPEQGLVAAKICHKYLRPGGHLRIAVPDGHHPDPAYIEQTRPGGTGAGAPDHKILYTKESLSAVLTSAGFQVECLEYFDESGHFHARDWNPADGMIHRSQRFDERNRMGRLVYTSLLVDAHKRPASASTSSPT
jgi:predicted SAM-dependent methyltransferase